MYYNLFYVYTSNIFCISFFVQLSFSEILVNFSLLSWTKPKLYFLEGLGLWCLTPLSGQLKVNGIIENGLDPQSWLVRQVAVSMEGSSGNDTESLTGTCCHSS
jgi:hypothetical protein